MNPRPITAGVLIHGIEHAITPILTRALSSLVSRSISTANNTPFDNTGFKDYIGFIEQPEIRIGQYISITNRLIDA